MTPSQERRALVAIDARFWAKVDTSGDCWEWRGSRTTTFGYGRVCRDRRILLAHRVSWEMHFGDPGDQCVLHRCDNPPCVRPDHLFLGDRRANYDDMRAKGRAPDRHVPQPKRRGEQNHFAKLTWEEAREIRALAGTASIRSIAKRYGIGANTAGAIIRGRAWREAG